MLRFSLELSPQERLNDPQYIQDVKEMLIVDPEMYYESYMEWEEFMQDKDEPWVWLNVVYNLEDDWVSLPGFNLDLEALLTEILEAFGIEFTGNSKLLEEAIRSDSLEDFIDQFGISDRVVVDFDEVIESLVEKYGGEVVGGGSGGGGRDISVLLPESQIQPLREELLISARRYLESYLNVSIDSVISIAEYYNIHPNIKPIGSNKR